MLINKNGMITIANIKVSAMSAINLLEIVA